MIIPDSSILPCSIWLTFKQGAFLERDRTKFCLGVITWKNGFYGTISNKNIQNLRNNLKDLSDMFINDYLAANPPIKPVQPVDEKAGDKYDQ
jgi:hypothetical protein